MGETDLARMIQASDQTDRGFWENVVNTMDEGLVIVSPRRRIVWVNQRAEQLIGATLDEVAGKLCTDAINCPNCQCRCRLYEEGQVVDNEVEIYHRGSQRPATLLKNARLLHDPEGTLLGGIETFKDITGEVAERREKQDRVEQLFREKQRTEALLGSLREGVLSVDHQCTITDFSHRAAEITGVPREDALGRHLFRMLGVDQPACPPEALSELQDQTYQREIRTPGGRLKQVELVFRPVRFQPDEVLCLLRDLTPQVEEVAAVEAAFSFHGIVSRSEGMRKVFRLAEKVADSDLSVLIYGESGTGKELLARAIHRLGSRRDDPFNGVNCATFRGELLLSELFGHVKGAFTGAVRARQGKLELAGRGTLFLDEVSEIPLEYQALLLRVLEERHFEPVGGHKPLDFEARVISATNVRLCDAVRDGRFREDLHYRLKVVPIEIPPLRERPEDIELLANYFLKRASFAERGTPKRLSPEVLRIFRGYPWPGNVRELRNLAEYLHFVSGDVVGVGDLPEELRGSAVAEPPVPAPADSATTALPAGADERARVLAALEQARFHRGRAAEALGVDRTTLWRRMRKLGISG